MYKDLPEDSFRLLNFTSNSTNAMTGSIECELDTVRLSSKPIYNALSYTWNNEKPWRDIICNGQHLHVTPSLFEALLVLQQAESRCPLWIDAICIDQSNRLDKERQVQLMGTYYSQASSVIVWLCLSGPFTDLVFEGMDRLLEAFQTVSGHVVASKAVLESYSLPAPDDNVWRGIGDLYSRSWFQRLWTVQEVALAQQTMVYCGSRAIEWRHLANLAAGVSRAGLVNHARGFKNVDSSQTDGFSGTMFPDFIAEFRSKHKAYPLHTALHFARSRQASEPMDKVYAVLGLIDEDARGRVRVDYSEKARENLWRVYIDAVKVALTHQNCNLGWLLMEASSQEVLPGLPSWCPNFNSRLKAFVLPYQFSNAGGTLNDTENFSINDENRQLSLQAYHFDTVAETVEDTWQWHVDLKFLGGPDGCAARSWAWMNRCLELARRTLNQQDIIPEPLVRTLVADVLHEPPTPSPDIKLLFKCLFPATVYLQALRDLPHLAHKAVSDEEKVALQRYLNPMTMVCGGRGFFATTGGRIGIGPAETRVGNIICVLKGARVPFVFRAVPEGEGLHELVGEAYVHGVMQGELFAGQELAWKSFTLV